MIAAVILAAGQSKRMGKPKMLLPWGNLTVIEHVITTFINAGLQNILVVTGGAREQVEKALEGYPVQKIDNEDYATGEMLSSLQKGLRALAQPPPSFPQIRQVSSRSDFESPVSDLGEVPKVEGVQAALIGLGDQPQIQEETVRLICETFRESGSSLIVPSFQMRRGHPWLVARPLWEEILALKPPESPRDFLNRYASQIRYVNVSDANILADLDTPEDYQNSDPQI